jgi:hypothetical protein
MLTLAENVAHNLCNSNNTAPSIGIIRVTIYAANGKVTIGKPRVSPLCFLNTSAVIRYLICVYASHFFAGRPYHFNQTLCTANKFWNGDNRWMYRVCFEKYWSLMKVPNQPTLRRMKIYYYWTNIRKWNYFNTSFIEDFRK